jgi:hypothetical protein
MVFSARAGHEHLSWNTPIFLSHVSRTEYLVLILHESGSWGWTAAAVAKGNALHLRWP